MLNYRKNTEKIALAFMHKNEAIRYMTENPCRFVFIDRHIHNFCGKQQDLYGIQSALILKSGFWADPPMTALGDL